MNRVVIGFFCTLYLLFIVNTQAQVLFHAQNSMSDTLIVSIFGKPIRFTDTIKRQRTVKSKSDLDSLQLAWLLNQMVSDSSMVTGVSAPARRLRDIPSILPVRIARRDQYRVSSWFGLRCHPVTGRHQAHNGMDFPQPAGTPVYATADGYVSKVGIQPGGLGLAIQIAHRDGFSTTYGHLSRYELQPGQWVKRGQRIGRVGETGLATGPHLHYIVWYLGCAVDPRRYCFLAAGR